MRAEIMTVRGSDEQRSKQGLTFRNQVGHRPTAVLICPNPTTETRLAQKSIEQTSRDGLIVSCGA